MFGTARRRLAGQPSSNWQAANLKIEMKRMLRQPWRTYKPWVRPVHCVVTDDHVVLWRNGRRSRSGMLFVPYDCKNHHVGMFVQRVLAAAPPGWGLCEGYRHAPIPSRMNLKIDLVLRRMRVLPSDFVYEVSRDGQYVRWRGNGRSGAVLIQRRSPLELAELLCQDYLRSQQSGCGPEGHCHAASPPR
jgi:hypothetical protein